MKQYDVIIVGGGMVGALSACLLAQQGRTVALIESQMPAPYQPSQPFDLRVSAISQGSVALLSQAGAWPVLTQMRLCPYRELETWELTGFRCHFAAAQLGLAELGYIIENRLIQLALLQQSAQMSLITHYSGVTLTALTSCESHVSAQLSDGQQITGRWLLGCDGANSRTRELAGIGLSQFAYRQHCLLINVDTEAEQQAITWQQFTPHGPRAFLPLAGRRGSLVWYDAPARVRELSQMSNHELAQAVRQHFPARLDAFNVTDKGAFALVRRHAHRYSHGRVVLLGDAAHTINPLAGQGVNLGFKDVACWVALLAKSGEQWHEISLAKRYERRRRPDNMLMQSAMDLFYSTFSNDLTPLKVLRNVALNVADKAGPLKKIALRYALGLR